MEKEKLNVDVYRTKNQIVICGYPEDESHNCDQMGCSSVEHVLYRFTINERKEAGE